MPTEPFTQALDHSAVVSNFVFLAKTTMFQESRRARKRCEKVDISASFSVECLRHKGISGSPQERKRRAQAGAGETKIARVVTKTATALHNGG
jgi:hypothetical protein